MKNTESQFKHICHCHIVFSNNYINHFQIFLLSSLSLSPQPPLFNQKKGQKQDSLNSCFGWVITNISIAFHIWLSFGKGPAQHKFLSGSVSMANRANATSMGS